MLATVINRHLKIPSPSGPDGREPDALRIARDIVSHLPSRRLFYGYQDSEAKTGPDPRYPAEEIYGIVPRDPRFQYDVREVIARIVDGSDRKWP